MWGGVKWGGKKGKTLQRIPWLRFTTGGLTWHVFAQTARYGTHFKDSKRTLEDFKGKEKEGGEEGQYSLGGHCVKPILPIIWAGGILM